MKKAKTAIVKKWFHIFDSTIEMWEVINPLQTGYLEAKQIFSSMSNTYVCKANTESQNA